MGKRKYHNALSSQAAKYATALEQVGHEVVKALGINIEDYYKDVRQIWQNRAYYSEALEKHHLADAQTWARRMWQQHLLKPASDSGEHAVKMLIKQSKDLLHDGAKLAALFEREGLELAKELGKDIRWLQEQAQHLWLNRARYANETENLDDSEHEDINVDLDPVQRWVRKMWRQHLRTPALALDQSVEFAVKEGELLYG